MRVKMPNITKDATHVSPDAIKRASKIVPLVLNPDGTFSRIPKPHGTPATLDPTSPIPVLSKDIPLNPVNKTWVRIFLPRQAMVVQKTRMPLIVFFHGGGFVRQGVATPAIHNLCVELALRVAAVVVSVEYRLAPEHRLPAAYEDGMDALHWIKNSPDDWVREYADLSMCFLMGSSSGGNIAYHVGLNAALAADDLSPVKIQGLILHQPGFCGSRKTASEMRFLSDPNTNLPKEFLEIFFQLALPVGSDFDHQYSNPMATAEFDSLRKVAAARWMVMVMGSSGDPLIDRQIEFGKMLERKGVCVVTKFDVGAHHGVMRMDQKELDVLVDNVNKFVTSSRNKIFHASRL